VRDIRSELAFALEGAVQAGQHGVESMGQLTDPIIGQIQGDALAEVGGADLLGSLGDGYTYNGHKVSPFKPAEMLLYARAEYTTGWGARRARKSPPAADSRTTSGIAIDNPKTIWRSTVRLLCKVSASTRVPRLAAPSVSGLTNRRTGSFSVRSLSSALPGRGSLSGSGKFSALPIVRAGPPLRCENPGHDPAGAHVGGFGGADPVFPGLDIHHGIQLGRAQAQRLLDLLILGILQHTSKTVANTINSSVSRATVHTTRRRPKLTFFIFSNPVAQAAQRMDEFDGRE